MYLPLPEGRVILKHWLGIGIIPVQTEDPTHHPMYICEVLHWMTLGLSGLKHE